MIKVTRFALRGTLSSVWEDWDTQVKHDPRDDEQTARRQLEMYVESRGSLPFPLSLNDPLVRYLRYRPSSFQMRMYGEESDRRIRNWTTCRSNGFARCMNGITGQGVAPK